MSFQLMGLWKVIRSMAVLAVMAPAMTAAPVYANGEAQPASAGGPIECYANGSLVRPVVPSGFTWIWVFVANFNHAPLVNQTHACVAIARKGISTVEYRIVTCPVEGNIGGTIGGGVVNFDGGGDLRCDLTLDDRGNPGLFTIQARPTFSIPNRTHTLVSADTFAFRTSTDALCAGLTLSSTYGTMSYQNMGSSACGTSVALGSYLEKNGSTGFSYMGTHRINGVSLGNTSLSGSFGFNQNFSLRMGAIGETFTLDELVVDPPGRCCGPA